MPRSWVSGGGGSTTLSYASNSNDVGTVSTAGASSLLSRADHVHAGFSTVTSSSSNTLTRSTLNLRAGTGIALGLDTASTNQTITITNIGGVSGGGGGGAGSLVLLESHTASTSATLDFTAFISATYDSYLVRLIDVVPVTDANILMMRFSTDGGSTYVATGYTHYRLYLYGVGTNGTEGSTSDTSIQVGGNQIASGGKGVNGNINLWNPGRAGTNVKSATLDTVREHTSVGVVRDTGGGSLSVGAVNAVRFLFSSGNIASGTIRIYGVAKS